MNGDMLYEFERLAKTIFKKTQGCIWEGGQGATDHIIFGDTRGVWWKDSNPKPYWLLSPEIEMDCMKLRIMITGHLMNPAGSTLPDNKHALAIFIDNKLKYPGGVVLRSLPNTWDRRISKIVNINQGKSGYIAETQTFIDRIHGLKKKPFICSICKEALAELDNIKIS